MIKAQYIVCVAIALAAPLVSTGARYSHPIDVSGIFPIGRLQTDPHFTDLITFDGTKLQPSAATGLYYNLLTEKDHHVNARFSEVGLDNETLAVTEVGLALPEEITLAVVVEQGAYLDWLQGIKHGQVLTRHELCQFTRVMVNAADFTDVSDHLLSIDDEAGHIFFPKITTTLAGVDDAQFPIVVVRTSLMEIVIWMGLSSAAHLSLSFKLMPAAHGACFHGLLGQTLHQGAHSGEESGTEAEFQVASLLSTVYSHSLYSTVAAPHDPIIGNLVGTFVPQEQELADVQKVISALHAAFGPSIGPSSSSALQRSRHTDSTVAESRKGSR